MNSLNLVWTVKDINDREFNQFNSTGEESKFNLDWFKYNSIKSFSLQHTHKPLKITVDLTRGFIFINSNINPDLDMDLFQDKTNIRLIFFRRHRRNLSSSLQELSHEIIYVVGFQYNNNLGNNYKVINIIDQEGNILEG